MSGNIYEDHMAKQEQHNIVLYDWLSFTLLSDEYDPLAVIDALALQRASFRAMNGQHGYQDRLYYDGISVHYNGQCPGVWVELSGQGCRNFETLSPLSWEELFAWIKVQPTAHITRVDIAYDDHQGIIDMPTFVTDVEFQNYVSKFRSGKIEKGFGSEKGTTVYFGSPSSDIRLRVYDKAAERHKEGHWIRLELQLRDDRASEFLASPLPIGQTFAGVLANYLRIVEDNGDKNKSRWPMVDYWAELIDNASGIRLFSSPGVEYNEDNLYYFVFRQAGNAIDTAIRLYGVERFIRQLKNRDRSSKPDPKYQELVDRELQSYLQNNFSVSSWSELL